MQKGVLFDCISSLSLYILFSLKTTSLFFGHTHKAFFIFLKKGTFIPEMLALSRALALVLHLFVPSFFLMKKSIDLPTPVMGKLFKEGAKGKEKNFRRANIIY